MISWCNTLKACGDVRTANMLRSVIGATTRIRLEGYPTLDSCMRYILSNSVTLSEHAANLLRSITASVGCTYEQTYDCALRTHVILVACMQANRDDLLGSIENDLQQIDTVV